MSGSGIDLSTWLTDAQARAQLGISDRSLDREVAAGRLHPQQRPCPGRRPERVFDPAEIAARQKSLPPRVMIPDDGALTQTAIAPSTPPMTQLARSGDPRTLAALVPAEAQIGMIAHMLDLLVEARKAPPPWTTLAEASAELNLSERFLRRLVNSGALPAIRDRKTKVHRADLADLDVTSELLKPKRSPNRRKAKGGSE